MKLRLPRCVQGTDFQRCAPRNDKSFGVDGLRNFGYCVLGLKVECCIAEGLGCIGIHNCAWNADPYIGDYATVPNLGYIDMGLDSDLARARETIAQARRALMYTPMDLTNKLLETIRADLERVARDYAPCDVVVGDIEAGTPDERVLAFLELCGEINLNAVYKF